MKWEPWERKFYAAVGERIRDRRRACELPQETLADAADMTRANVSNIEAGRSRVQVHTLVLFADALCCKVECLLP